MKKGNIIIGILSAIIGIALIYGFAHITEIINFFKNISTFVNNQ